MTTLLPTEKAAPTITPASAKVLLYGPPKIGKSTLASKIDPDHTLFLACEPGLSGLEVFQLPITSWKDFREVGAALSAGDHSYSTVVVDTVDELYRFCMVDTMATLDAKSRQTITHPSDLEFGKGWEAVKSEFALRVGRLCSLGLGVWFISHSTDREVDAPVGKQTVTIPTVPKQARTFVLGLVDFILLARSERGTEGEQRVLRTAATGQYEAGGRVELTDPLPLDATALTADMRRACQTKTNGKAS